MQHNPITFDKRPLWARLGIKKFKRDGLTIYECGLYEIVEQEFEHDPIAYSLKLKTSDSEISIDFKPLINFLMSVASEDIPFGPLPKEERAQVKALMSELKEAEQRVRELRSKIDSIKDGYEDEEDIVT